jgi:hypothetical protein
LRISKIDPRGWTDAFGKARAKLSWRWAESRPRGDKSSAYPRLSVTDVKSVLAVAETGFEAAH